MQLLPTITTITPGAWRDKVKEAGDLKLEEVAIFPTCLNQAERRELYQLLEKTSIKSIPFVHIKEDMGSDELVYLLKHYQTKAFNIHTNREHPVRTDWAKYRKLIYIENTYQPFNEEEIKKFAGICLDFSHLENDRLLHQNVHEYDIKMIEKYPPGCGHISAIKTERIPDEQSGHKYASHRFEDLSEFDYLKRYPLKYFALLMALELENSLEDQLKVKEYITDLLNIKK